MAVQRGVIKARLQRARFGAVDRRPPTILPVDVVPRPPWPSSEREAAEAVVEALEWTMPQVPQQVHAEIRPIVRDWNERIDAGDYSNKRLKLSDSGGGKLRQWMLAGREHGILSSMVDVYRQGRVQLQMIGGADVGEAVLMRAEEQTRGYSNAAADLQPDVIPDIDPPGSGGKNDPIRRFRSWLLHNRIPVVIGALALGTLGVGMIVVFVTIAAFPVVAPVAGPFAKMWLENKIKRSSQQQLPPPGGETILVEGVVQGARASRSLSQRIARALSHENEVWGGAGGAELLADHLSEALGEPVTAADVLDAVRSSSAWEQRPRMGGYKPKREASYDEKMRIRIRSGLEDAGDVSAWREAKIRSYGLLSDGGVRSLVAGADWNAAPWLQE